MSFVRNQNQNKQFLTYSNTYSLSTEIYLSICLLDCLGEGQKSTKRLQITGRFL